MRLIALLLILIAPAANAYIVTYEYVGAEYDYVLDPATDPSAVGNPFLDRTQNRVTGRFYLDTDYLADGDHRNETITYSIPLFTGCEIEGCEPDLIPEWYFFDGVQEQSRWTGATAGQFFRLTTDARGDITSWTILLLEEYEELFITDRGDTRRLVQCGDWASGDNDCVRSHSAGTWRQIPEPTAFGILAAGLFAAWRLRRRGHSTAV